MDVPDISSCLDPVSADSPTGKDLQYDPEYLDLFKLAKGKEESQFAPGEEPNWRDVKTACIKLLKRTKDLRVMLLLALALLKTDGIHGLVAGMEALKELLEKYWPNLHPALDEDDGDPLERINTISSLSPPPPAYNDPMRFAQRVREVPLTLSRVGKFSLADLVAPAGGSAAVDPKAIDAAFDESPIDHLQDMLEKSKRATTALTGIDTVLTEKVGARKAINFDDLHKAFRDVSMVVAERLTKRGFGAAPTGAETVGTPQPTGEFETGSGATAAAGAGPGRVGTSVATGEIRSAQDVVAAIERICQYYERNEPSSPIPLLLKRAKRLVSKSFIDIVRDLSPDALAKLEVISGEKADPD
jgi:type VI secretion system protein ImpA